MAVSSKEKRASEEEEDLGVTGLVRGSGALRDLSSASRGGGPAPVEQKERAVIARGLRAVHRLYCLWSRCSGG
jgi:hypothetical protein